MKEIRNIFIGAKVTPSQKEYIKESADKCGMSVSDYLLARAYNYEPKHRLTEAEVSALQITVGQILYNTHQHSKEWKYLKECRCSIVILICWGGLRDLQIWVTA